MGHYKSNVRDIEFNLFEVLGTDRLLGSAPFADLDDDTARGMVGRGSQAGRGSARGVVRHADRTPPVFDPDTSTVTMPADSRGPSGCSMTAEWWRLETLPELGGQLVPRALVWAVAEQVLGANPALHMYMAGAPFAGDPVPQRQRGAEEDGPADDRPRVGRDHGAHRARCRLRRRRRADQGGRAARRLVAYRGREAVHHLRPSRT